MIPDTVLEKVYLHAAKIACDNINAGADFLPEVLIYDMQGDLAAIMPRELADVLYQGPASAQLRELSTKRMLQGFEGNQPVPIVVQVFEAYVKDFKHGQEVEAQQVRTQLEEGAEVKDLDGSIEALEVFVFTRETMHYHSMPITITGSKRSVTLVPFDPNSKASDMAGMLAQEPRDGPDH